MNFSDVYPTLIRLKEHRNIFIETGSAQGDTAAWASNVFRKVVTIEWLEDNYKSCIQRFWDQPDVLVIHGDSAAWMTDIEYKVREDAVWLLDAHWVEDEEEKIAPSGVTPILSELKAILRSDLNHIICIDDARLFGYLNDYPKLEEIVKLAALYGYNLNVIKDILVLKR